MARTEQLFLARVLVEAERTAPISDAEVEVKLAAALELLEGCMMPFALDDCTQRFRQALQVAIRKTEFVKFLSGTSLVFDGRTRSGHVTLSQVDLMVCTVCGAELTESTRDSKRNWRQRCKDVEACEVRVKAHAAAQSKSAQ
jgi:hypothetical protein